MALPQVGQVFGRYRIDDVIGRGGMGVVLGATDTGLGRRVALKVVAADLGGTEEFRARFEREAATLARLDSPHVIAIYDYGTQDDCPYIATQYVAGGDLGALLHDRGPMTPADALRVCAQVADALDDAHRAGIVHRDVKPTNVLVRDREADEPHVYLCDFGIARTGTGGLTAVGAVAGTWSYLAPENGRGVPATESSDLYALGCLLWATLTGHPPYRGTDVTIALAHQRDPVPQLPGDSTLVASVNDVLRRSMAKEPADRYPDAASFRAALLAAADLPGSGTALSVPFDDPTMPPHTGVRPATPPGAPGNPPSNRPSNPPGNPSTPPSAPPPAWRPPSSPSTPPPTPAPASPARGRGRGRLVVAAVVVLALLGAGTTAVLLTSGDDDPDRPGQTAGPTGDPTTGQTGEPTDPTDPTQPVTDPTSAPPAIDGPVTGDLDGDKRGDLTFDYQPREGDTLLSTTWTSDGEQFVGEETAELGPVQGAPTWQLRGDLDRDDREEVVTFSQPGGTGPVSVTADLSGGGRFDDELETTGAASANDALADLDADGDQDLLTLDIVKNRIVLSTRTFDDGAFGPKEKSLTVPDDIANLWLRAGDFDGDGQVDLATLVISGDDFVNAAAAVDIRLGDGTGGFAEPISSSFTSAASNLRLLAADVDVDGDDELVIADADTRLISLNVFDLTDGTISPRGNAGSFRYVNNAPISIATSDVNGDRKDDVVAFGLQKKGGTARVQVAVSNGTTFTSSRWLAWDQLTAATDNADDQRFEIVEDARW